MSELPRLDEYRATARAWLEQHAVPRRERRSMVWGDGSDSVALFQNLSFEEERAHIAAARAWQQAKSDAGYGSITWEVEHGGAELPGEYAAAFADEEARFETPPGHEAMGITLELIGPTIRAWGTTEQRRRFLPPLRRTDEMWCQLFSEPGAGSDLARLSTRAERDGDEWIINGQKVWTSGAQFADWGYGIFRTDPHVAKHAGLTAFLVPMNADGVDVRPLRQMSGGSSFNEVFFSDVRIPDHLRLGGVGDGWKVAITTLGFERASSSAGGNGGSWERVRQLAGHLGRINDPVIRQRLAALYAETTALRLTTRRVAGSVKAGQTPGPEGSIGKLAWTESLRSTSEVVSALLGPRLLADTGEWGTYAWSEYITGAPGYRIAGGSDEVQRNIIGERVLGLPPEPRIDHDVPYNELLSGPAI